MQQRVTGADGRTDQAFLIIQIIVILIFMKFMVAVGSIIVHSKTMDNTRTIYE